ncbi:MAG: GNAT family N-acetyltransferase [Clostridiales bacterium]|nr:GNAT family N-acetyltransferase [Clostridiales bacterium]
MLIRWMETGDIPDLLRLADEVGGLFGHPGMAGDPQFLEGMKRRMERHEAIAAVDRKSGRCRGAICFSRKCNEIVWLAVETELRGNGMGRRLLDAALLQLDWNRPVWVVTFHDGQAEGIPARRLYEGFGFRTESAVQDEFGNPRSRMVLEPDGTG